MAGGAGFIGSHVIRHLQSLGAKLRIFDLSVPHEMRNHDFIEADITDRNAVEQAVRGVDVVINAAALVQEGGSFEIFRRINVEGAVRLAESARRAGAKAFVQFSSVMVYGFDYPAMVRETGPFGGNENPYCQTKIEGELALLQMHRPGSFEILILRPGDVYGPGSIPWVIRPYRLMKKRQFMLVDGGAGTINHLYIDNLVDAMILLLEKNAFGRAYNVTDGARTTFREFFRRIAHHAGIKRLPSLPYRTAKILAGVTGFFYRLLGKTPDTSSDSVDFVIRPHPVSVEALTALGFVPRVGLDEGMRRTLEWLSSANDSDLHPARPAANAGFPALKTAAGAAAALFLYLCFWPVKIDPHAYKAPANPGYTGVFARNEKLVVRQLPLGGDSGPEHIVVDQGWIYTAVESGAILRMRLDGSHLETYAQTGGRPLGFAFDAKRNLIVADAFRGLVSVNPRREIHVLLDSVQGSPLAYADAVVVAKTGRIYLTDASLRFPAKDGGTFEASILDVLEHSCTGRLVEVDKSAPAVLASGICFANGLALDAREESVFVAETGAMRILRVWISGPKRGQKEVFLDQLPGYPDNLMRGRNGRIWAGLPRPRSAFADRAAGLPFLRKLTLRLPRFLWPVPPAYGHVFAFDESGKILVSLQDPSGKYPDTTGVTETDDTLYIQSLHAHGLGTMLAADAFPR